MVTHKNNTVNIRPHNLGHYEIPESCNMHVCVDIGANVGDFTVKAAGLFDMVYFYEPYKPCFDIAVSKTSAFSNVLGHNKSVYHTDGLTLPLVSHNNKDSGSNALKTDLLNNDWNETVCLTQTVSLSTVIKQAGGHIDYLKLDCETSEYSVLNKQDLTNIDFIGMELHCQMGSPRYYELLNYIMRTHTCRQPEEYYQWNPQHNKELLFCKK